VLHVETAVPAEPASLSLGTSSTAAFITAFDDKVQESGKQVPNIRLAALTSQSSQPAPIARGEPNTPPRLLSDQYISEHLPPSFNSSHLLTPDHRFVFPRMAAAPTYIPSP